ncbi:MAG: D-glycero-beta-D-manno-heptose-7-phosphate kinase [Chromatiaceae bacterium]
MFQSPDKVLNELRAGFGRRKIIVVGDLMLDRYLWGDVERISPEAPVPVVKLQRESLTGGGAANVARNLAALGLDVHLAGTTGSDDGRTDLLTTLVRDNIRTDAVVTSADRPTSVKTRVIGNHQQMLRIDEEQSAPLPPDVEAELLAKTAEQMPGARALVLSDYAKGVLTSDLCSSLIGLARKHAIPVIVDPKSRDFSRYAGASVITPNRAELALAADVSSHDSESLLTAAMALRERLNLHAITLTLGEQGMALIDADGPRQIPAVAREVFDVSGAGDTVAATLAAGLAANMELLDTAHLANLAAGVVVGKVGTAVVSSDELIAAIQGQAALDQAAKICDRESACERVRTWQLRGEIVVFTNGCFDLLHVGHVTYLEG